MNVLAGIGAVAIYCICFLGSCSPIHCRLMVALGGIFSVTLTFFAGFGMLFFAGYSYSTFHTWQPFLLMCIGVEHLFVICHAVDQTNLIHSSYTRIFAALSHAGPAITITSLATSFAFAFGMFSSLEALRSFCLFAFVQVLMLYISSMTIFLSFVVWDTRRVEDKGKECCGLCCCEETSILCCGGKLTSLKQREFTGVEKLKIEKQNEDAVVDTDVKVKSE